MNILLALAFTLAGQLQLLHLPAASLDARWSDPRTPSCRVFEARARQMEADLQEIDFILKRLEHKSRMSREERSELEEAINRQTVIARESRDQTIEIEASFVWPENFDSQWAIEKKYRLAVVSPGLEWAGQDSLEPNGLSVSPDQKGLMVRHEIHLADYCRKPRTIELTLTQF